MTDLLGQDSMAAQIFAALPGSWSLARDIPGFGRMAGTAEFVEESAGNLLYRETVEVITAGGGRFDGTRAYRYELADDGIAVRFADPRRAGRDYVRLVFEDGLEGPFALGIHYCGQDIYRHVMTWICSERFRTEIAVTGPRKDDRLLTDYRRSAAAWRSASAGS